MHLRFHEISMKLSYYDKYEHILEIKEISRENGSEGN